MIKELFYKKSTLRRYAGVSFLLIFFPSMFVLTLFVHPNDYFFKSHQWKIRMELMEIDTENDSIFFLETTGCKFKYERKKIITARQACAVESAARTNPDKIIYLLYFLRNKTDNMYNMNFFDEILTRKLLNQDNIKIKLINMDDYMAGSPLEEWYKSKKLDDSKFMIEHSSDVLRYLTLWKYGGTYMDLDFVVMKSLQELGTNFIGRETDTSLANGILSFDNKKIGHEITSMLLEEVRTNFKSKEWAFNGPQLVTRVLKKMCNVTDIGQMTTENCKGFQVLDASNFFAIPYQNKKYFFDSDLLSKALSAINESYAIHVWNKLSHDLIVYKKESSVLYGKIAEKFCPVSFNNSGDTF